MSSSAVTIRRGSARACTNVEVERFSYEWVIKNFKLLPQKNGECMTSPSFWTGNNEAEWKLEFYPRGCRKNDIDHLSLCLVLNSHQLKTFNFYVHVDICILPLRATRTFVFNYEKRKSCGFHHRMQRSELLEELASDDTLTIQWKMELPCRTVTNPTKRMKCMEEAFDSQQGQLSQDFGLLYKVSKFMDVTILVGTQKFPAHKLVLAARSPVFSAMFEHKETRENLEHEVKIEKMEPAVVEAMLEFFYTDQVTELEELAHGLLEAAEKYDLPRLRIMCEKALYDVLNKENAADILVHADLHRSLQLKEYVMEFMADHLADLVQSEGYKKMENEYPRLATELTRSFFEKQKSKQ